jgi:hypothetical protein
VDAPEEEEEDFDPEEEDDLRSSDKTDASEH